MTERGNDLERLLESCKSADLLIEVGGTLAAVLLSPDRYESLVSALEELEDVEAFDAAMAEPGDNVPMDQVEAELGWR